jgi:hypothetical protein
LHKVLAGLLDAYLYCDSDQALTIAKDAADWTGTIVNGLNEEQRLKMLNCEYGGMNEVLANIYAITGDEKYLAISRKFHDEFVLIRCLANIAIPMCQKRLVVPGVMRSRGMREIKQLHLSFGKQL